MAASVDQVLVATARSSDARMMIGSAPENPYAKGDYGRAFRSLVPMARITRSY